MATYECEYSTQYADHKPTIIDAAIAILRVDAASPALKSQATEYLKLVIRKAHEQEAATDAKV